jgi:hypothetical protein
MMRAIFDTLAVQVIMHYTMATSTFGLGSGQMKRLRDEFSIYHWCNSQGDEGSWLTLISIYRISILFWIREFSSTQLHANHKHLTHRTDASQTEVSILLRYYFLSYWLRRLSIPSCITIHPSFSSASEECKKAFWHIISTLGFPIHAFNEGTTFYPRPSVRIHLPM